MTFEEWFTTYYSYQREYTVEYLIAQAAWKHQQARINELESQLEDATMFHYKRGFQDAKEIHMRKNAGLLANIKVLEAQLEVADIRPMEESEYLERIEELEQQVEWHKRRAEGWRSIAVLEEQGRSY